MSGFKLFLIVMITMMAVYFVTGIWMRIKQAPKHKLELVSAVFLILITGMGIIFIFTVDDRRIFSSSFFIMFVYGIYLLVRGIKSKRKKE